ncbi:MAG: hypothetical protein HYR88_15100 [Verrucomicrobia bacterium]|nr:hypothetical protein [Verrucomicrobiota bacterium]MBI3866971.1 hypothetical protein [Verrucomicrobiota bacterium]
MSGKEQPIGTALIICDHIITELGTNKKTLVGTFNNINGGALPVIQGMMSLFASLTNGQGRTKLLFRCTSVASGRTCFEFEERDVEFLHPNQVVEVVYNLKNLVFENPGVHCIELLVDGSHLMETRFNVTVQTQ